MFNTQFYPLGKRPLLVRVENYLLHYGMPADRMVPMHPDEWLDERNARIISGIEKALDIKLYGLGLKGLASV